MSGGGLVHYLGTVIYFYGQRQYAKDGNKMKFISNGQHIEIVAVYSWFDVYFNNTMVLHHISKEDVDDLVKVLEK